MYTKQKKKDRYLLEIATIESFGNNSNDSAVGSTGAFLVCNFGELFVGLASGYNYN